MSRRGRPSIGSVTSAHLLRTLTMHRINEARGPVRKTLYIGNLASHDDAREVERLVASVGQVLHFKMMVHDDFFRRDGGFAVVELESEADADRVAHALHGRPFNGSALERRPANAAGETACGPPRMFGSMNMGDDTNPPKRP